MKYGRSEMPSRLEAAMAKCTNFTNSRKHSTRKALKSVVQREWILAKPFEDRCQPKRPVDIQSWFVVWIATKFRPQALRLVERSAASVECRPLDPEAREQSPCPLVPSFAIWLLVSVATKN